MKGCLVGIAIVVVLVVVGLAAYLVPFYTVAPSFSVQVTKQSSGDYRVEIDPNFVVRSVYSLTVSGPGGVLAQRDEPRAGGQHLNFSSNLPPGTVITIECSLQYDRIAPSITNEAKTVSLP